MSKLYQNISRLVFRRNIPIKLEEYVFNCEMLQVLTRMDGKKTVAAIAADMNLKVEDLLSTFFTLYRKNLIFIVKTNPGTLPQPVSASKILNAAKAMVSRDAKSSPGQKKAPDPMGKATQENSEKKYMTPPAPRPGAVSIRSKVTPSNHLKNSGPMGIEGNAASQKALKLKKTDSTATAKKRGMELFKVNQTLEGAGPPRHSSATRLLPRKTEDIPPNKMSAAFSILDKNKKSFSGRAVEYFEKGLEFLQQREYGKALRQFELSLEIDPQNRLCRANIQRIRKLLGNGIESLKITQ